MILGVSVTKSTGWRGIQEEFTNVWHFDATVDTTSKEVADAVVAGERPVFGPNVNFKRVQVWGPADAGPAQNQMLLQEDLTGTGEAFPGAICAKELSVVASWDTGRVNTRGGRIFLRKYLHVGQLNDAGDEAARGNAALPAAVADQYKRNMNAMKNIVGVGRASICDRKGRKLPLNTDVVILPHLHIRQFRR
jgi:hypothetical protein